MAPGTQEMFSIFKNIKEILCIILKFLVVLIQTLTTTLAIWGNQNWQILSTFKYMTIILSKSRQEPLKPPFNFIFLIMNHFYLCSLFEQ